MQPIVSTSCLLTQVLASAHLETHLLPGPQAVVLLELALVVWDIVLAVNPAAKRQYVGGREISGVCSAAACELEEAMRQLAQLWWRRTLPF